ncbi:hypothetical protein FHW69_001708 [Luteibacter sp. Sphag1AF]|uniref:hypothetical protein n=1 Tax=Luteibacter sp. Sphag1AF TaxID=2587031 RepID=UPI0016204FCA|nr:hypothetical protein [Luteibacter sp. Sphag1AF]MBB3227107.1 hypothetical protein [Luteibacter sp. Sphag1AF]
MKTMTLINISPVARRFVGAVASLLLFCAVVPNAHAQWEVTDSQVTSNTSAIKDNTGEIKTNTANMRDAIGNQGSGGNNTVNANLYHIDQKLTLADDNYLNTQPGTRMADPTVNLPTAASSAKLDDGSRCKSVAQPQQATCQKIVDIENSQYQYMLTVYETSKTRDTMLRDLLKEREKINSSGPNQFAMLENNTNKLTALYNLIALDHQQMLAVNYAYEANLRYLRQTQTLAANAAATGKTTDSLGSISIPGIGSIDIGQAISGLTTGMALGAALDGVATSAPSGMQRLSITDSSSW